MLLRRTVAFLLVSIAYVVGTHWLMTRPHSPWNVVGVLSPMLLAIAIGAWKGGQRTLGTLTVLGVAALCAMALTGNEIPPNLLYLAQHAGVHGFLAIVFGSTLRAGQKALITILATRVHGGSLTPGMALYTRRLTLAWVLYFVAMVAISLGLYAFASFQTWAVFANLLTPIAMALMFGVEYLLRYRLHPEFERSTIADAIRSYMRGNAA